MSVTVQQVLNTVCFDILEDNGLTLGLLTTQDFLDLLDEVLLDFLRQTDLVWQVFTQVLNAGVSQYLVPDAMSTVQYVFQNAQIVEKEDIYSSYLIGNWQRKNGPILSYHEDGLPIKTIEVLPAPNWDGTNFTPTVGPPPPFGTNGDFQPGKRNLTFVGTQLAKESWSQGDTLTVIPDSFTPYLTFGILARIFSMDGELKDINRSQYCTARYQEGIMIARSILMEGDSVTAMVSK